MTQLDCEVTIRYHDSYLPVQPAIGCFFLFFCHAQVLSFEPSLSMTAVLLRHSLPLITDTFTFSVIPRALMDC